MFSPPGSDNADSKIKQRLVGAAVLIALAVIIVPMILDFRKDYDHVIKGTNIPPKPDDFHVEVVPLSPPGESQALPGEMEAPPAEIQDIPEEVQTTSEDSQTPSETIQTSIGEESPPPSDTNQAASVEVKPLPADVQPAGKLKDEVKAETPPPAAPAPQAVKKTPVPKTAVPTPKPVVTAPPVKADKTPAPAVQHMIPPAVTTGEAWVVQVGSFSNQQNADELRTQLQKSGYKAFVDEVNVSGVPIHRVRVGPLDKKAVADAIRDKLAIEMKLDTRVFSYP